MSSHELAEGHRCPLYPIFHPWSKEIPEEEKCCYWVTYVVIALLTAFVVPLLFYLAYYLVKGCSYLCCRIKPIEESAVSHYSSDVLSDEAEENSEDGKAASTVYDILVQEIELTEVIDEKPNNPRWLKREPKDDPFYSEGSRVNHAPIYIHLIGTFSESDKKAMRLMTDFLAAFHKREVHLVEEVLSMKELGKQSKTKLVKKREWENGTVTQYRVDEMLSALTSIRHKYMPKGAYQMAFTSKHLYSSTLTNYVFGTACYGGPGVFSKYRFGDADKNFYEVVARLMKIAGHEFGHMLCMGHCSKHKCNIGGYMTLQELDERPFYFCSKDSAKICSQKGITLKEYYTDLLDYFENFKTEHAINLFDEDIAHVKKKLKILKSNPQLYTSN